MGVNSSTAAFIANAKQTERCCFDRVLTIGHLSLNMSVAEQTLLFQQYPNLSGVRAFPTNGYADDFLKAIAGASSVSSLDYSDYENCDIVHDLNKPIASELRNQFDAVIDGGCLEHVFNVPMVLHNYASLVKPGGTIILATVANNHMGHGFYQFSPELFFNYFSVANGFDLHNVVLVAHPYPSAGLSSRMEFYDVVDPRSVSTRVGLVSDQPIMIMVHAVKRADWSSAMPHLTQSDYEAMHESQGQVDDHGGRTGAAKVATAGKMRSLARQIAGYLPSPIRAFLSGRMELRRYSLRNTELYRRRRPFHFE